MSIVGSTKINMNKGRVLLHLILLIYVGSSMVAFCFASNYATYINNIDYKNKNKNKNINILHDNFTIHIGRLDRESNNGFFILVDNLPWIVLGIYIVFQINNLLQNKLNLVPYACFVEGTSMFINSVLHCITILPDANMYSKACYDPKKSTFGMWIFMPSLEYCGDMMWSGHTQHVILAMVLIYKIFNDRKYLNNNIKRAIFVAIIVCIIIFEMIFLVVFRLHYSIDTIISALVNGLLYTHPLTNKILHSIESHFARYQEIVSTLV